jgi:hypothetical protein
MVFLLLCPHVFALFDFDVFHIQLSSDRYGICETYTYICMYVCMYVCMHACTDSTLNSAL